MGDTAAPRRRAMNPAAPPPMDFKSSHALSRRLVDGLESVIRGKRAVLEHLVTGILAGGHVLIEDVPGLGKTTLAKTVARLISRSRKGSAVVFRRIQFTPDLLPYDITGVDVFDPGAQDFRLHARSRVRQRAPRRRDQPHHAEGAVGPPGSDGRGAGHGGQHDLPDGSLLLRHRHAEPGGDGGRLSAAARADRPFPHEAAHRLPRPGGRGGNRAGRPLGDRDARGAARVRQGGDPRGAHARGRDLLR